MEDYIKKMQDLIKDMYIIPPYSIIEGFEEPDLSDVIKIERFPSMDIHQYYYNMLPYFGADPAFVQSDEGCSHDWKNYLGFTESYEYCAKCNEKKDIHD
jgi:hypothetical protein